MYIGTRKWEGRGGEKREREISLGADNPNEKVLKKGRREFVFVFLVKEN